jgi:hypothetical protein
MCYHTAILSNVHLAAHSVYGTPSQDLKTANESIDHAVGVEWVVVERGCQTYYSRTMYVQAVCT